LSSKLWRSIEGFGGIRPFAGVELTQPLTTTEGPLDLSVVYEQWFGSCLRWLRALGVPDCDLEDVAQEVFLVVQRKLVGFEGDRLAAWIYRIAARTASDYRRRAWFRRWWRGDRGRLDDLASAASSPAELVELKQARRQLDEVLSRMSEKRRVALVLFEIEGYSGEEIAEIMDVPVATVWTRLHHARKEFLARVAELPEQEER
jgi:RNA polymerase sigma-70 factor (ECF subfamily)